jgi:hypothetical protein
LLVGPTDAQAAKTGTARRKSVRRHQCRDRSRGIAMDLAVCISQGSPNNGTAKELAESVAYSSIGG